ncbi:hypothetical protein SASPL_142168 [Salvia splendens]|uniref:Uncharacterized protein n=1 Tax=Salvia splendens TaxID=180675 RepID=A0A8X8WIP6_SALSN|nr:hypothetical protein SASPL_142168 [Salvia splendens]
MRDFDLNQRQNRVNAEESLKSERNLTEIAQIAKHKRVKESEELRDCGGFAAAMREEDRRRAEPSSSPTTVQQLPIEIGETEFLTSLAAEYKFEDVEKGSESDKLDSGGIGGVSEYSAPEIVSGADDLMCNKENECVAEAKLMLSAAEISDGANFVKPPTSARFSHRRNLKASNEDLVNPTWNSSFAS